MKEGNFPKGIRTMMGVGSPGLKNGIGISTYSFTQGMGRTSMYSADGDLLIVPQCGALRVTTELGKLYVPSKEIVVIPRGCKFKIDPDQEGEHHRGWIAEIFKGHLAIPDLGPIGANGLANERDFLVPKASYKEDHSITDPEEKHLILARFNGKLF